MKGMGGVAQLRGYLESVTHSHATFLLALLASCGGTTSIPPVDASPDQGSTSDGGPSDGSSGDADCQKLPNGASCFGHDACCSGYCFPQGGCEPSGFACIPKPTACRPSGTQCVSNAECCGGICETNKICSSSGMQVCR